MIRTRRINLGLLNAWLTSQAIPRANERYRVRVWREGRNEFEAVRPELVAYVNEALDDARRRLRDGFEEDLSPFNDPNNDPAANYPSILHQVTLQGYFGEILSAIAVEHWGAHGNTDWAIPAFLFRLHNQEFQHLDSLNARILAGETIDTNLEIEQRPGRTGDDCIAFRMNDENVITDICTLEAKCLSASNTREMERAHQKLVANGHRPSGILELINLLSDYETPESQRWQNALLRLWRDGYRTAARHDGVAYAVGQRPVRPATRIAWLPTDRPHAAYTLDRGLEGMEFQFEGIDALIDSIFRET